ncbi:MAG: hypothetical protein K8R49_05020 [Candidatus Cloacimonetes bacterium]|nr:hypothetical protein [Candidatus Cloacimonadota bacterium]
MKKRVIIFIAIVFVISNCFAQGTSEESSAKKKEKIKLEEPANLSANAINDQYISLKWEDNCNIEKGYKIERKDSGGDYKVIATLKKNSTSYVDEGLSFGKKYTYRVFCYLGETNSGYSKKVTIYTIFPGPREFIVSIINDQSVKLNWIDDCSFEEGFIIERAEQKGEFTEIVKTSPNIVHYRDEGLSSGVKYTYRIYAFTSLNKSEYSNKVTLTTEFPCPTALATKAIDDQTIRLTWKDMSDFEQGFRIERKEAEGEYSQVAEVTPNATYYINSGLTSGKVYFYRIKAFSPVNESDYSNEVSIKTEFPVPQKLRITLIDDQSLTVYWEDKNTFVESYKLERKEEEGEFILITELGKSKRSFIDKGLTLGVPYTYRIKGISALNESAYSSEITDKTVFPGPGNLYYEEINDQSLKLFWDDNCKFEEGFQLERKEEGGEYEKIADIPSNTTSYQDNGLTYGITYYYRTVAVTSASVSPYSNEISAHTIFPEPSYLSAVVVNDQSIKISWVDNCIFDEGFQLERKDDDCEFNVIATLEEKVTSFLDEGLRYKIKYVYRVASITKLNISLYSNAVPVTTIFPGPTFLTAEVVDDHTVALYWEDNCEFEKGYKLEKKMGEDEFSLITTLNESITSYTDTGLLSGRTFVYRVYAYSSLNESDYSNFEQIETRFPKPTELNATIVGDCEIKLTWVDNCFFEDGYQIERGTNGNDFTEIGRTTSNVISYNDKELRYGTEYFYRIKGFTSVNSSDYSDVIKKTMIIDIPVNISLRIVGDEKIKISWEDNYSIEDGFKIERRTADTGFELYTTIPANTTFFVDSDTKIHEKYFYRLYCYVNQNRSEYSDEINGVCHYGKLRVPEDFPKIQEAIDSAIDGNLVIVQPGTYKENIYFKGKSITVCSQFFITGESSYISRTIIDGNRNGSVVSFENAEDSKSILTGFTITNGSGNDAMGGGLFIYHASPTIQHCAVIDNNAGKLGGGIYLYNSNPVIEDVVISGNSSVDRTSGYGGGIYLTKSNPKMTRMKIISNTASEFGGGVYIYDSNPEIKNCIISGNKVNGVKYGYGGGIYSQYSHPVFENLTIYGNSALSGGGIFCNRASDASLINSILWNNSPQQICFHEFGDIKLTIKYTNIEALEEDGIKTNNNGTIFMRQGVISSTPMFEKPESNNFKLQSGSPCIDSGDPSDKFKDADDSTNDLGAHGGPNGTW